MGRKEINFGPEIVFSGQRMIKFFSLREKYTRRGMVVVQILYGWNLFGKSTMVLEQESWKAMVEQQNLLVIRITLHPSNVNDDIFLYFVFIGQVPSSLAANYFENNFFFL